MTGRVCSFEGCGRPHKARDLCRGHYSQLRRRPGKPLTPITEQTRRLTAEVAEMDVEEFEFLLSAGDTVETALARLDVCARTMCRRYQVLDRPAPPRLWTLSTQRKAAA